MIEASSAEEVKYKCQDFGRVMVKFKVTEAGQGDRFCVILRGAIAGHVFRNNIITKINVCACSPDIYYDIPATIIICVSYLHLIQSLLTCLWHCLIIQNRYV